MLAKDVMTTNVITVSPETSVQEVAQCLLERGISAVPVVDAAGKLLGIVSEGDLMRRSETGTERKPSWWLDMVSSTEDKAREYVKSHGTHARDVMTRQLVTTTEDATLEEIATLLEKHHIKRVPVVRGGKVVGIVSRANLLRGLIAKREQPAAPTHDDRALRDAVTRAIEATGARAHLVSVMVSGGKVQLWGAVDSTEEKDAIRVAAETVPGVQAVDENLRVFSGASRPSWA
jgi:CBS domain-containing protein